MKNNRKKKRPYRGCAVVTDDRGVAVRLLPDRDSASRWLDKHRPGLAAEEKRRLVKAVSSPRQASREFEEQVRLGCADADVLVMLTYFDGTSTRRGLDLRTCRPDPDWREKAAEANRPGRRRPYNRAEKGKTKR